MSAAPQSASEERSLVRRPLDGSLAVLTRADAYHVFHARHYDLAVADLAAVGTSCRTYDSFDDGVFQAIEDDRHDEGLGSSGPYHLRFSAGGTASLEIVHLGKESRID